VQIGKTGSRNGGSTQQENRSVHGVSIVKSS
jgi:hypothetical protein